MVNLTVNSIKAQEEIQSSTFRELLDEVLNNFCHKDDVVTDLSLDGEMIDNFLQEEFLNLPIPDPLEIEIKTQNKYSLAFESLDTCEAHLGNIISKIQELIVFYQEEKNEEANLLFAEVVDFLYLFSQTICLVAETLKEKINNTPVHTNFKQSELDLLTALRALLPAKEKNNIVMIKDLLEYELLENLISWQNNIIPQLKELNK